MIEEAERAVLGSMIIEPSNKQKALAFGITEEHFALKKHVIIYKAILNDAVVDALTLSSKLKSSGDLDRIGGPIYIDDLIDSTPTDQYLQHYCIMLIKHRQRKVAEESARLIIDLCREEKEPDEIASKMELATAEIRSCGEEKQSETVSYREIEDKIYDYCEGNESRGLSTGYGSLDRFFRHKKGMLIVSTGVPNSGKSEAWDQLMLNTMVLHGWKWTVFSPENYPPEYHFAKLAEKYIGKPAKQRYGSDPMSRLDIRNAINFYDKHLKTITPGDGDGTTLAEILNRTKKNKIEFGCDGLLIDPYNEIEHKIPNGMSETQYCSSFLSRLRNFGRLNEIEVVLIAHPKKMELQDSGEYRVPSLYDISGSAHFYNKADVGISVWRSFQQKTYASELHITKIRDRNIGERGMVSLKWSPITGRYDAAEIQQ